jgi:hypothetical protein
VCVRVCVGGWSGVKEWGVGCGACYRVTQNLVSRLNSRYSIYSIAYKPRFLGNFLIKSWRVGLNANRKNNEISQLL